MPEEIEIDTDKIEDDVKEQLEREGGSLLKAIALTTALFAAFAAIAALRAGGTVNEALVLKTEATRLQAEASDEWTAYQAKGIKAEIQRGLGGDLGRRRVRNRRPRSKPTAIAMRMNRRTFKPRRANWSASAMLNPRRPTSSCITIIRFADSVALFQVAIALGAVAALARYRLVWFLSMVLGVAGCGAVRDYDALMREESSMLAHGRRIEHSL